MITQINNPNDVAAFALQLTREKIAFHPDDDFNDYIYLDSGLPAYSRDEAHFRNKLMDSCFKVCEYHQIDIYSLMLDVFQKETNLYF